MSATISTLGAQHQEVLARLAAAEEALRTSDGCDQMALVTYLENDVTRHFALEEAALFPVLERYPNLAQGPVAVMHTEHAAFRRLLETLAGAAQRGEVVAQRAATRDLIELLRQHIAKEDQVLFPLAARMLNPEELREVDARAAALDRSQPVPA
jgi:hemerythrin-like domain-containing protein